MRMILKRTALTVGLIFIGWVVNAQSKLDLRINEVLIINNSNYVDNYGSRSAWIEIFNSAYNKVNIGGCYLTDDLSNPTKYSIPRNDPNTIIPTRFFIIFWADNKTTHGTFHLNFKLDSTSKVIALFDGDGKTLIDSVSLPIPKMDISFARTIDGSGIWQEKVKTTPMATNTTVEEVSAGQKFAKSDPIGVGMAMVAMSVVFVALILLYLFFKQFGLFNIRKQKKNIEAYAILEGKPMLNQDVSGEVLAAISTALYLHETEQHDYESTILTINRANKNYSPWSSKIYGLRNSIIRK
jgi:Na+-transporting methylmalonyl-CoA/oxaloacetate decarboxylase gamma subunit